MALSRARLRTLELQLEQVRRATQTAILREQQYDQLYDWIERLRREVRELRDIVNAEIEARILGSNYGPCFSLDGAVGGRVDAETRTADAALIRLRPTFVAVASPPAPTTTASPLLLPEDLDLEPAPSSAVPPPRRPLGQRGGVAAASAGVCASSTGGSGGGARVLARPAGLVKLTPRRAVPANRKMRRTSEDSTPK